MAQNSSTIIDLSDDIGSEVTQNAVFNHPSSNPAESFERSCDNPECSAPRLISLVPKPVASEFVTEPMIVHKPTLINGFTTVFQIDGASTRMDDIINEAEKARNEGVGNQKPKTVFRVVPNSHAHIVNYVVVEAAADTMLKIKENDPETMCKLLVSQRLSAEQMLKKLISKALETKTSKENVPIASPIKTPAPVPTEISSSKTPPSKIPPGITVKLISASEENKKTEKPNVSINSSSNNKVSAKATPVPNKITKPTTPVIAVPIKPTTPSQNTETKQVSKTTTPSQNTETKQVSKTKTSPQVIQKTNQTVPEPKTAEPSPRPVTAATRTIAASKPVVWQAVPPASASKSVTVSPKKTTSPVITRNIHSVITASASIPTPPLASTEFFDVEKSIAATSITVHRSPIDSQQNKQQTFNKRKSEVTIRGPESVKRLRPRSPNRVQNATPLAGNIKALDEYAPETRKLPTLPQKNQKTSTPKEQIGKFLLGSKPKANPNDKSQVITSKGDISVTKGAAITKETNIPSETSEPVRRKVKPLMGPASKMKALKALAEEKSKKSQIELIPTCQTALNTESAPIIKIGETTITRTGSAKSAKAKEKTEEPTGSVMKPCSVAITDIVKNTSATESDTDSKSKPSGPTLRSSTENDPISKEKVNEVTDRRQSGRWIMKRNDEIQNRRPTRSTASLKATLDSNKKSENVLDPSENISDSTLLTTPSAPNRVLRVVLPSTRNGIVNNPPTSPHPNLKISSVISRGEKMLSKVARDDDAEGSDNSSGPGIEQLQKELADLRRTVAKLTGGKNV